MEHNSTECRHCGQLFYRLAEKTPIINRSDGKEFHLSLFSGPRSRPRTAENPYQNQIICNFTYTHRRIDARNTHAVIVMLPPEETEQQVGCQIEDAADRLVALVAEGRKLEPLYSFGNGRLTPGFPLNRNSVGGEPE